MAGENKTKRCLTGTACWPCRQRKVKCDNQQPCENCVKREHSNLCSYKPNRSVANKGASSSSSAAAAVATATQKGRSRKRARSSSIGRDGSREAEDGGSWPGAIGT